MFRLATRVVYALILKSSLEREDIIRSPFASHHGRPNLWNPTAGFLRPVVGHGRRTDIEAYHIILSIKKLLRESIV